MIAFIFPRNYLSIRDVLMKQTPNDEHKSAVYLIQSKIMPVSYTHLDVYKRQDYRL